MNRNRIGLYALSLLAAIGIACSVPSTSQNGSSTKDQPVAGSGPTGAATTPARNPNEISGDGTFAVPSQVKPGTYRTVVPNDSTNCYYARLKNATGAVGSIIANNNADAGSQQIVEIASTDKFFTTEGCGTWTRVN